MCDAQDGGQALVAAGELGPFFAVHVATGPGWRSWAEVVDAPAAVEGRVAEVRAVLAGGPGSPDVEARVAASIAHLGLVARLVSPLLGAALVTGLLPVADPSEVRLHLSGDNPVPLSVTGPRATPAASPSDLVRAFERWWLRPALEPLAAAVGRRYALSPRVLEGNAASAVAAALTAAAAARGELGPRAEACLAAFVEEGPLRRAGRRRSDGSFVRGSCCLFYRVPGAGTCADCVLGER